MLEKWIRPLYQRRIIRPIIPVFSRVFTPDQITVISGIFGIAAGLLIALNYPLIGTLLLLLSGIFDTLDGTLARHMSQTSNFGCVIDIFTDRIVECSVIFGLFFIDISHRAIPSMLMLISIMLCITSFLVVGVFTPNEKTEKSFYYSVGLIERFEAFIFFIAMIWLPNFFSIIASLFASLVLVTALVRLYQFKTKVICINPAQ